MQIWLVLGLSLGASALYSIVAVIQRLFAAAAISAAVTLYAFGVIITHIAQLQHSAEPTSIGETYHP